MNSEIKKCIEFLENNGYKKIDEDEYISMVKDGVSSIDIGNNEIVFIGNDGDWLHIPLNRYALFGAMYHFKILEMCDSDKLKITGPQIGLEIVKDVSIVLNEILHELEPGIDHDIGLKLFNKLTELNLVLYSNNQHKKLNELQPFTHDDIMKIHKHRMFNPILEKMNEIINTIGSKDNE